MGDSSRNDVARAAVSAIRPGQCAPSATQSNMKS
ncbi:MAG: hypothetical protein QOJ71_1762 [Actinomycetota bacterium]|nr:hypothetical protein [Actinomycetota bacterium]